MQTVFWWVLATLLIDLIAPWEFDEKEPIRTTLIEWGFPKEHVGGYYSKTSLMRLNYVLEILLFVCDNTLDPRRMIEMLLQRLPDFRKPWTADTERYWYEMLETKGMTVYTSEFAMFSY